MAKRCALTSISRQVGMSPFRFARTFSGLVGYPLINICLACDCAVLPGDLFCLLWLLHISVLMDYDKLKEPARIINVSVTLEPRKAESSRDGGRYPESKGDSAAGKRQSE
jgi:hypothetical protein